MSTSSSHNDIPEDYRPWCLDRREPVQPGDPVCADPNCDAHRREAAGELTRLGEELGDDDLSPEQVAAGCREARRQLAAEREQEG